MVQPPSHAYLALLALLGLTAAAAAPGRQPRSAFGGRLGPTFNLTAFGAVGDNKTLNTEAFRKAVARVEAAGGGTLVVPPGAFRTGPVNLTSKMTLFLDTGASIFGPTVRACALRHHSSPFTFTAAGPRGQSLSLSSCRIDRMTPTHPMLCSGGAARPGTGLRDVAGEVPPQCHESQVHRGNHLQRLMTDETVFLPGAHR